jgi:hypothetical protein
MLFPTRMGTPKVAGSGSGNAPGPGGRDGTGAPTIILSPATPSGPAEAIESMRRVFKPLQENDPQFAGFQIPAPGMVKMRQGGPTIGGPGFDNGDKLPGGTYDSRPTPGLSFKSDMAKRVWLRILAILKRPDPTMSNNNIMAAAIQQAGVKNGELPAEDAAMLSMGLSFYLAGGPGVGGVKGSADQGG